MGVVIAIQFAVPAPFVRAASACAMGLGWLWYLRTRRDVLDPRDRPWIVLMGVLFLTSGLVSLAQGLRPLL